MISNETIQMFQQFVREESKVILNDKEAKEILQGLTNYFDLLAKINHRRTQ